MRRLRNRILLSTMAIQAVALLLLLFAGHRIMVQLQDSQLAVQRDTVRELLNAAVAPQLAARDYGSVQELASSSVASLKLAYLDIYTDDDRRVAQAGTAPADSSTPKGGDGVLAGDVYRFSGSLSLNGQDYGRFEVGLPATPLLAAQRRTLEQTALIGGAALLLSLLLLLPLTTVLTRRISRLAEASSRIARGEPDVQLPVQGQDEVAQVTHAFNQMSVALRERVAALTDSEARQRALVEALAEGVVFQDDRDRVLSCNEAAPRILGVSREQLLGLASLDPRWRTIRRDGSPLPPDEHPSVLAQRSGKPQRDFLMGVLKPDGSRAWLQVNSEPLLRAGSSRPYATVTSFNDISSLIEAEDRLQQLNADLERRVAERTADLVAARDAAERASLAKSEFMSRMSHELRTPLNAILGFAQVLQMEGARSGLDAGSADSLAHIERAGWHLLDLINDVLDLSRIEAGALSVSLEPVLLAPLAAECLRLSGPAAAEREVALLIAEGAAADLAVSADRVRLRQVLMNLLSNAIKYNRRGGEVLLRLTVEGDEVLIAVRDTGRGFTEAQRDRLYEPFNRLGAEHAAPGTGIGLVITRRLVELMHGRIELDSTPGVGSTFTVRLPRAMAAVPALPAGADTAAPDLRDAPRRTLLYIEDNPSNVDLLRSVLALRPDLQLQVATTGAGGLLLARQQRPDLVLVDIDLPDIDGHEVCRRLRADPTLARLPIAAVSANAMPADLDRGVQSGFDAYLTKPLELRSFLRHVERLLGEPRRAQA